MKFIIDGKPQPKQRPRVTKFGTYTPKETKNYEILVKWLYTLNGGKMLTGPISMSIKVVFKLPKAHKGRKVGDCHTQRPDIDNICKAITDSLNGLAYQDDGQIARLVASKEWGTSDYVEVEIQEV